VEQKFVDAALEKARAVTQGQLGSLVKKEKLTQEQADSSSSGWCRWLPAPPATRNSATSTSWSEAVPEKMEIKQAVFGELDAAGAT
jgi:enoyl-CoA hydratase/3-hydroxyacyl-CoA dehydrogenase